jgi:hypothetical protein
VTMPLEFVIASPLNVYVYLPMMMK